MLPALVSVALCWQCVTANLRADEILIGVDVPVQAPRPGIAQSEQRLSVEINNIATGKFDAWLFGGLTASAERQFLESLLRLKVNDVDEICGLTAAQKERLHLACRADIRRLFEQVDDLTGRLPRVQSGGEGLGKFVHEVHLLRLTLGYELNDERSFFAKAIGNVLSSEQAGEYARVDRERRSRRYTARIERALDELQGPLRLRDDQRQKFARMLLDETQPPRRFGAYDVDVVLLQAARLPEARVRALVDADQWRILESLLQSARAAEPMLREAGLAPEAAAVPGPAGTAP